MDDSHSHRTPEGRRCCSVHIHEGHHSGQSQQPFSNPNILSSIRDQTLSSEYDRGALITLLHLPVTCVSLQTQLAVIFPWDLSRLLLLDSPPPHLCVFRRSSLIPTSLPAPYMH